MRRVGTLSLHQYGIPAPSRPVAVGLTVLAWAALSGLALRGLSLTPAVRVYTDDDTPLVTDTCIVVHLTRFGPSATTPDPVLPQLPPSVNRRRLDGAVRSRRPPIHGAAVAGMEPDRPLVQLPAPAALAPRRWRGHARIRQTASRSLCSSTDRAAGSADPARSVPAPATRTGPPGAWTR
ncbi:hypothetical protein [Streptomyces sp. NPDC058964]|uniref:hypothetical protein n=1 Tax=Streptomyces sp. NPDC058964 TaxID=3346681 RepID=UPI00367D205E